MPLAILIGKLIWATGIFLKAEFSAFYWAMLRSSFTN